MISGIDEKTGQPKGLKRIPKKVLDKQDFIKLFITQLQYQDPMKPIDNNEMAMQLALFNQVDQLFNINDTLKTFKDYLYKNDLTYATSLIGKKVKMEGNIGRVEDGKFFGGEFTLDKPVNTLDITIRDENGKVIRNITLHNLSKGTHKIEWDGKDNNGNPVKDGNYKFTVTIQDGKKPEPVQTYMYAKITGVLLEDKDNIKLVANDNVQIDLDKIKEVLGG